MTAQIAKGLDADASLPKETLINIVSLVYPKSSSFVEFVTEIKIDRDKIDQISRRLSMPRNKKEYKDY